MARGGTDVRFRCTRGGVADEVGRSRATAEEREEKFSIGWEQGNLVALLLAFNDVITNKESNDYTEGVHPQQDPLDRQGSSDRRRSLPLRPSRRHQAALPRHRLLPRPTTGTT